MPPVNQGADKGKEKETRGKASPAKQTYTVKAGQTIRVGRPLSRAEQDERGDGLKKESKEYTGGDTIELTEAEARSMRHALEDPPELTDAEYEAVVRAQEEEDEAQGRRPRRGMSRGDVEEAMRSRRGPMSGMPDLGRLPASREVEIMLAANRRQERDNRNRPGVKGRDGSFDELSSGAAAGGGTGPNAGTGGGTDNPDDKK